LRIFQRLTIPQTLKKAFAGFSVKYEIVGTFNRREYCVQYQETDSKIFSPTINIKPKAKCRRLTLNTKLRQAVLIAVR
jgi:hypothetical protein